MCNPAEARANSGDPGLRFTLSRLRLILDGIIPTKSLFCLFTFALSYDLIRLHQRPLRDRQTDLIGGFLIDHELEPHRLFHRQVGRLSSLQDFVHVGGGAAILLAYDSRDPPKSSLPGPCGFPGCA